MLVLKFTLHKIPGLEAPFFLLIVFLSVWLIRCPYTLRRPMSFWSVVESHYLPMQVKPLPQGFLMIFFHRSYTYVLQVFFFQTASPPGLLASTRSGITPLLLQNLRLHFTYYINESKGLRQSPGKMLLNVYSWKRIAIAAFCVCNVFVGLHICLSA